MLYHHCRLVAGSGRLGGVVGEAVALKACGCEPSAQRPVVGSGAVPSLQTSCCSAVVTPEVGHFALNGCGCEPSAQRPVVGSGAVPSAADKLLFSSGNARSWSTVALNGCGCEPSAQRPVVGSGAVPSAQTSCCSGVGAAVSTVALKGCGCEPSAQRPVVGSGAVPSATDKLLFRSRSSSWSSCSIEGLWL